MNTSFKPKILVVDDDTKILELLKQFFDRNGFESYTAADTDQAEKMLKNMDFDLLVLDVMLPRITGFEFAKQIKSQLTRMPIMLLTALSEPDDRVRGLEMGADDYVVKPFNPRELLLRAKNLLELYKANNTDTVELISFGNCSYDLTKKEFLNGGAVIALTSTEQKLLELFLGNIGKILNREELSKAMGGLSDRSIDVQIVRLRQKIEEDPKQPKYLQTVRHEGYAFYK